MPSATAASRELPGLPEMLDELDAAPGIYAPSAMWRYLSEAHLEALAAGGFAEFKRTVNRNYFHFLPTSPFSRSVSRRSGFGRSQRVSRRSQFRAVVAHALRHPAPRVLTAAVSDHAVPDWSRSDSTARRLGRGHARYVALLYEYVSRRLDGRVNLQLDEPALGHPLTVQYRGRVLSEDLCNSWLELAAISDALGPVGPTGTVVELGAGYGRLGWLILTLWPGVRYVVVDIPPALAVAQRYLSDLFPDRRLFRFRHLERFEEVRSEFAAAEIAFLTPNQLEVVSPLQADLFVNISSLHEMRTDQISHYFELIDAHTAGCFYTKQWRRSVNPWDQLVVQRRDYPVPSHWEVIFDRVHPVQRDFFEACYRVGPGSDLPSPGDRG